MTLTLETIQATLPNLSLNELETLQKAVANVLKEKQKARLVALRQELEALAEKLGLPYDRVVEKLASERNNGKGRKADTPKRKLPLLFRHPTDPNKGWTGRGLPPKWIKEWEAQGRSREELRIPAEQQ